MKKIRVRVMTGAEFDALSDNDNFTCDDNVVLIVIHDNGKICMDFQTECTRSSTIINRLRKAVEGCTDSRITDNIKADIKNWLENISECMEDGVYSEASAIYNWETGRMEYTGDYSFGVEFVGDDDMPEWYMFLNFLTSEAMDRALEAARSAKTAQTTENTPDNTNTPTAGAETTTDTITESADSAEREATTMKKTMLTYKTLDRFEAEYIIENYTAEELEQVEHAAYVANMNTCAHPEWTEADIFTDFLRVLDIHKITVSKKTAQKERQQP